MSTWDAVAVADDLEAQLAALADPDRAEGAKRYLKSDLRFLGVTLPDMRSVAKAFHRAHPDLQ